MAAVRRCDHCHSEYVAKTLSGRWCSERCRSAHRFRQARGAAAPVVSLSAKPSKSRAEPSKSTPAGRVETSTRVLLESHGALGTALGDVAVGLAGRIDVALAAGESGASISALVREHRVTLAEVTRGGQAVDDPIDELRRRRDARSRGA